MKPDSSTQTTPAAVLGTRTTRRARWGELLRRRTWSAWLGSAWLGVALWIVPAPAQTPNPEQPSPSAEVSTPDDVSTSDQVSKSDADSASVEPSTTDTASDEIDAAIKSPTIVAPGPLRTRTLTEWARLLSDDSFHAREVASDSLRTAGRDAVPVIRDAIASGNLESVSRGVRLLADLAMQHPPADDGDSFRTLRELARDRFGISSAFALAGLREVNAHRTEIAPAKIAEAGAYTGNATIIVQSMHRPQSLLHLGDDFEADEEALKWFPWLDTVRCVAITGSALRDEVIDAVSTMPHVATLVLADGEASLNMLESVTRMDDLKHLEIQYVRLPKDSLEILAQAPAKQSFGITGSGLPRSFGEELARVRQALVFDFKQGGFLGVTCSSITEPCLVSSVNEKSGAAAAGLMAGDIILRVNDRAIRRFDDLKAEISLFAIGDTVEVEFQRDDETLQTEMTLGRQSEQSVQRGGPGLPDWFPR